MKLKFIGEQEIISAIRREFSASGGDLVLGIGDDAAVIKAGDRNFIITKDLLLEDFHFLARLHPAFLLGRKSLNVNLSDIAAMGGKPKFALLGLAVPSSTQPVWLEQFFEGFKSAADEWHVRLAGGDISQSKKITISVTVIGEGKNIIRRNGARPGHFLFVSGSLGDPRQGLLLLKRGFRLNDGKKADHFLRAFLDPAPQVSLGQKLSRMKLASAMIDVSDGLSVDLFHLCEESGCGAEIEKECLPLSPELKRWQRNPYPFALHGGEDYQLLFTIPQEKRERLSRLKKSCRLTCIGKMIDEKGVYLVDQRGARTPLSIKGYQHFK